MAENHRGVARVKINNVGYLRCIAVARGEMVKQISDAYNAETLKRACLCRQDTEQFGERVIRVHYFILHYLPIGPEKNLTCLMYLQSQCRGFHIFRSRITIRY